MQGRLRELEEKIVEERSKGQQEKKDQGEQIRSLKAEIKSLTDKIERCGKRLHSTLRVALVMHRCQPSHRCSSAFLCSPYAPSSLSITFSL